MDAEQPVAATPTVGQTAGIFDELPSVQQLSAGGAASGQTSGSARTPSILTNPHNTYIPPASAESLSIKLNTVLGFMHLMQLTFLPDNKHSISTLSREIMVQESFF